MRPEPVVNTPHHAHRRIFDGFALLVAINLFAGCGGDSGLTDAERVARSDYQRAQVTHEGALEALKKAGGKPVKKTYALGDGWQVTLTGATVTDELLEHLKTLGRVAELDLSKSNITDAQLPQLAQAAGICFRLNLSNTAITDAGLASLADMPVLMDLTLTGTKVSPAAAADFKAKRLANPKVNQLAKKNMKVTT
jgi:hypothetical protein